MRRVVRVFIGIVTGFLGLVVVMGIAGTALFGWSTVKETVLLADTLLFPYRPAHFHYRKLPGDWPTLPGPGAPLGTLVIPAIGIKAPTVQGTTFSQLRVAVGHYAASPLPGQPGNVVFSALGLRSVSHINAIRPGDRIIFRSRYGAFVYRVTKMTIVPQSDPNIIVPTKVSQLTLTSGYPFVAHNLHPTKQLIVWATPISVPQPNR